MSRFKRFVAKLVRVKKKEEEEVKRNLLSAGTSSTYIYATERYLSRNSWVLLGN